MKMVLFQSKVMKTATNFAAGCLRVKRPDECLSFCLIILAEQQKRIATNRLLSFLHNQLTMHA